MTGTAAQVASISQDHYIQKYHLQVIVLADYFGKRCIYRCCCQITRHWMSSSLTCCTNNATKWNVTKQRSDCAWHCDHQWESGFTCKWSPPSVSVHWGTKKRDMWLCDTLVFCEVRPGCSPKQYKKISTDADALHIKYSNYTSKEANIWTSSMFSHIGQNIPMLLLWNSLYVNMYLAKKADSDFVKEIQVSYVDIPSCREDSWCYGIQKCASSVPARV